MSRASDFERSRPKLLPRTLLASLVVVSMLLPGCSDGSSADSKIVTPADRKAVGEGSFKPNVKPTKTDAKAEPL